MPLSRLIFCLLLIGNLTGAAAMAAPAADEISAQALREDMDFLLKTVREAHPDLGFSTSEAALQASLDDIRRDLPPRMRRDEAWRHLARINPVLADGHLLVALPDWRADTALHRAAGGVLFPFELVFDAQGRPVIEAALGGAVSDLAGARIVDVDGVLGAALAATLLARTHGDTPAMRSALLAQRWWLYHWKTIGASAQYSLVLERDGRRWPVTAAGSAALPRVLQTEADVTRLFRLETTPGGAAVMTVNTFLSTHQAQFMAFTRDAFARMRAQGVTRLVIDISGNGGGDDSMWLEGLMPYLASAQYRTGSTAVKRVLRANPDRGEQVGQIVHSEIGTWRAPQPDNPALFNGQVAVRIGPMTYSSSVLFANVMHDFGFATLVGTGNAVRRTQSGGVYRVTLPHSGLALWLPRFVLAPPSGDRKGALLEARAASDSQDIGDVSPGRRCPACRPDGPSTTPE